MTESERRPNWLQSISGTSTAMQECDECIAEGKERKHSILFVFGASDSRLTFQLCLEHRNALIRQHYVILAEKRENRSKQLRQQAIEERYMDVIKD